VDNKASKKLSHCLVGREGIANQRISYGLLGSSRRARDNIRISMVEIVSSVSLRSLQQEIELVIRPFIQEKRYNIQGQHLLPVLGSLEQTLHCDPYVGIHDPLEGRIISEKDAQESM
jgi:hypothetical protein